MPSQPHPDTPRHAQAGRTAARVGLAAFMFFAIKGLLWLVVPALLAVRTCQTSPEGALP